MTLEEVELIELCFFFSCLLFFEVLCFLIALVDEELLLFVDFCDEELPQAVSVIPINIAAQIKSYMILPITAFNVDYAWT